MKIKKILIVLFFMFFLPLWLMSQDENVDLSMIYKIKQEGLKNSGIEELAFWLTDFVGPRLTITVEMSGPGKKWKSLVFKM
jgi:carboxypeptidase Q